MLGVQVANRVSHQGCYLLVSRTMIGITMNLYVHVTDEEKVKELLNIEDMLKFGT